MYTYDKTLASDANWSAYVRDCWAYVRHEADVCPKYAKSRLRTYRDDGFDFDEVGFIGYLIGLSFEQFIGWDGKPNRCPIWDTITEGN